MLDVARVGEGYQLNRDAVRFQMVLKFRQLAHVYFHLRRQRRTHRHRVHGLQDAVDILIRQAAVNCNASEGDGVRGCCVRRDAALVVS